MRTENSSFNPEVVNQMDLNKILDDLGIPVEVRRTATFLAISSMLLSCGVGHSFAPKPAENVGPDPNLSCPGDFDVSKGVVVNSEADYLALGTTGNKVEMGDDFMTEFNNGQLRLLRHVYGGKKLGDVNGWSFTGKDGRITSGSIQFSQKAEATCEDK